MIFNNPFSELVAMISPEVMQAYIVLMVIAVIAGTVLDMMHKKSAQYFFENAQRASENATRQLDAGEKSGYAIKTLTNEVLTSSEFKSTRRRISHLFTMYGFILFVAATVALVFGHATSPDAGVWPLLWHLGAGMLCFGGYWFWFFIRGDVASEGVKWYQFNGRGDLFIVGLITMPTFALLWSATMHMLFFVLFIACATMLFTTVFWSKFAHMFFKPAAAYQKKCMHADGSAENLPADYDLTDPEVQARFEDIPMYMGDEPGYMGLGIKREPPRHF